MLDSAAPGPLGEYSLLLRFDGEQLCKHGDGSITGPGNGDSFLSRLNDWYLQEKNPQQSKIELAYNSFKLKRMYYSAFRPIKGTVMEKEKPASFLRQNRLYNVDFLMREYKYRLKEFSSLLDNDMLPSEDPKLALAKANFDGAIDINEASYKELIRIPGIGPCTAKKIVTSKQPITRYRQLHEFGGWIKRAKPFIEVDGKRQKMLMEF